MSAKISLLERDYTANCLCNTKLGRGELTMKLNIKPDIVLRSVKTLTAKLSLRPIPMNDENAWPLQIGHIDAFIINKTMPSTYMPSQGGPKTGGKCKSKAWKQDLLESDLSEPSTDIAPRSMTMLFHPDGRPKTSAEFSARALRRRELCYISYLFLEREYRRSGLGSVVLNLLLSALPRLKSHDCFSGPVWLTPGSVDLYVPDDEYFSVAGAERKALIQRKEDENLERLVAFYKKNGLSVWAELREELEESCVIMGVPLICSEDKRLVESP
ncbi:hypothetical protein LTR78_002475 [Recurvomyces mirabilis]|uniref:Uncharacterized protein n=1 Tax=Recurvomyces mirabilis TaxID=574656 RepID=A0AAE1C492_9PEZI|nr:hypothetical protein LTR78_002475 [Recurvomyces mirabilis]KAK5157404.1 hypothetical protein LTS14_004169 [Recurvomyces mirabilis]